MKKNLIIRRNKTRVPIRKKLQRINFKIKMIVTALER